MSLAVLLLLLSPSLLDAEGQQTGLVTGTLRDADGEGVPGVAVELGGPQIRRQAVTDDGGRFRFPALGIGTYSLRAELLGLVATAVGVQVSVNTTTSADLTLGPPAQDTAAASTLIDWIRVIAEVPIVDRLDTSVGANVRFAFLEDLPVERFYQSVALLLPGVAGGEDGNPNVSGALRNSNLYLVDGVDTTDPTTGLFGLNVAYEAIDEVEVTTAAAPIEYGRASGAMINVVTRSGGSELLGLARWVIANNDWNDAYSFPDELTAHLRPEIDAANAGPDRLDSTLALRLDGPIAADRLFFAAAWEGGDSSFLRPTVSDELWDEDNTLESGAVKLTAQASASHTIILQHTFDEASFASSTPFTVLPGETRVPQLPASGFSERPGDIFAIDDRRQEGSFSKAQWYAVWSQNLSTSFNLADQERDLERGARNRRGFTADAPHWVFSPVPGGGGGLDLVVANGVTQEGFERRPRDQRGLTIEYFLGRPRVDQTLSFGIDFQETESTTLLRPAGQDGVDRLTGRPVTGQLFLDADLSEDCLDRGVCRDAFTPDQGSFLPVQLNNFWLQTPSSTREKTTALYFSDTIELDRFVVRAGLRLEMTKGTGRGEGLPGTEDLVDTTDVAPRLGLTYDLEGDGAMLLSAAWGRFYEPFQQQFLDAFERSSRLSGLTIYSWITSPGCAAEDPSDITNPCWTPVLEQPFSRINSGELDSGLERSFVDEVVLGFQRELGASAGLSVHYISRRWRDLWDDFGTTDPELGTPVVVVDQIPGARRTYQAIQMLFQRRFADRWELLASFTRSAAEGNLFSNIGLDSFANPSTGTDTNLVNRFGPAAYDSPNQLGIFGTYLFPFERFGITLATALRYRDGTPFQQIRGEDGGVRFLTPRGSERLSGVLTWDLAVNLDVRLGGDVTLEGKVEVFNLTGESEQLGADSFVPRGRFGLPRSLADLQRPRSFRFTVGVRF